MEYNEWIFHGGRETTQFLFGRAQDQAQMQLSEMEEEMDQRIHAAERKTREQVGRTLSAPRDDFEELLLNNPASFR